MSLMRKIAAFGGSDTLLFMRGQSNCFGKGDYGLVSQAPINQDTFPFGAVMDRVWICNRDTGVLEKMQVPVNNAGVPTSTFPAGGFGIELGCGQRWMEETSSGNLIIFKSYIDGSPIANFEKPSTYYSDELARFQGMVTQYAAHGLNPTRTFAPWIQGEGDNGSSQATYLAQLQLIFSDLIADGVLPTNTTQVITQIQSGTPGYGAGVAAAKTQYVGATPTAIEIPYVTPVNTDYYIDSGLHMNAAGQLQFAYNIMEEVLGFPSKQVFI